MKDKINNLNYPISNKNHLLKIICLAFYSKIDCVLLGDNEFIKEKLKNSFTTTFSEANINISTSNAINKENKNSIKVFVDNQLDNKSMKELLNLKDIDNISYRLDEIPDFLDKISINDDIFNILCNLKDLILSNIDVKIDELSIILAIRLIKTSAFLNGFNEVRVSDLFVLKYLLFDDITKQSVLEKTLSKLISSYIKSKLSELKIPKLEHSLNLFEITTTKILHKYDITSRLGSFFDSSNHKELKLFINTNIYNTKTPCKIEKNHYFYNEFTKNPTLFYEIKDNEFYIFYKNNFFAKYGFDAVYKEHTYELNPNDNLEYVLAFKGYLNEEASLTSQKNYINDNNIILQNLKQENENIFILEDFDNLILNITIQINNS